MVSLLQSTIQPRSWRICSTCAQRWAVSSMRWSSTEASPPPLLSKMKSELKAAMKAKDAPRLNVLRAVITDFNNAAKTSSPIVSDMQIVALLRKRKASSEEAEKEALGLNREDIAAKQRAEIQVMDEYAGSVKMMAEDEIKTAVQGVIDKLTGADNATKSGQILKEMFKPGGVFDGKMVDRAQVSKLVTSILGGK